MPSPPLDAAVERSTSVRAALEAARRVHSGQVRNSGDGEVPFIEHPVAVAARLAEAGFPDPVLAAALLHDVVEKSDVEIAELRQRFGDGVADLVDALTENEAIEPYGERKDEHRQRVANAEPSARAIFAADKLVNLEGLRAAYASRGEEVDEQLAVSLDSKIRTWQLDLEMLSERSPELPLVGDFANQLKLLLADRANRRTPSS